MTNKRKPPREKQQAAPLAQLRAAEAYNGWWPGLFDVADVKALAVGIREQLIADAQARDLPVKPEEIRPFLRRWTRQDRYRECVLSAQQRHGLNGEVSPITQLERDWTRQALAGAIAERKKADAISPEALEHLNQLGEETGCFSDEYRSF